MGIIYAPYGSGSSPIFPDPYSGQYAAAGANIAAANAAADAQRAAAQIAAQSALKTTQLTTAEQLQAAQIAASTGRYGSDAQRIAAQYAADAQKAAALAAIQAENQRQSQLLGWQQTKFNTLLPIVQGGLSGSGSATQYSVPMPTMPSAPSYNPAAFMSAMGGGAGGNYGFNIPTHAPVLSDQQVQQQVNNAVARNQQSTQTGMRTAQQELGGRGFAASSPILASIRAQLQGAGMASNANADLQARINAAQLNAAQAQQYYGTDVQAQTSLANAARAAAASMYGSQVGAGANIYSSQMDAYNKALAARVQEEQIAQSGKNALITALAGMMGA